MAYNSNTSSNRSHNSEKWEEADGFLNFSLPDENGEYVQLGMISLRKSDLNQVNIYEQLEENPELAVALLKLFKITFKPNRKKARSGPVKFNLSAL